MTSPLADEEHKGDPPVAHSAGRRRVALLLSEADISSNVASALAALTSAPGSIDLATQFIEDRDLLDAAALSFTTELCSLTNLPRPLTREHVEQQFRVAASHAQTTIHRFAVGHDLRLTFEVIRERRLSAVISALGHVDWLVLANSRRAPVANDRGANVIAFIDNVTSLDKVFRLALVVAEQLQIGLVVCRVGNDLSATALADFVRATTPAARVVDTAQVTAGLLLAEMSACRAQVAIFPSSLLESQREVLREIDRGSRIPLVFIR